MCDSPNLIKNPFYGLEKVGINFLRDTTSAYIPVPCGHCSTCISLRQSYFVQRCQCEQFDNYLFMGSLSYQQSMIPIIEVNGRKLKYPDWSHVQKMIKRIRQNYDLLPFRIYFISEYGSEKHRPHFHFILSYPKTQKDERLQIYEAMNLEKKFFNLFLKEWRVNVGSRRNPIYKPLCRYVVKNGRSTYDLHYINPSLTEKGEADVAFYVTKYILKSNKWLDRLKSALKLNLSPEEFEKVWKLLKPKCCPSKGWGNPDSEKTKLHIRKGIELAKESQSEFPFFINPVSGQTFPLSPFYQKRFYTLQDKFYFFYNSDSSYTDGTYDMDERNMTQIKVKDNRLQKIKDKLDLDANSYDFIYDNEDFQLDEIEQIQNFEIPDFLPDNWCNDFSDTED